MDLKHRSRLITEGRDRAGARSMFKAIGFTSEDLAKPLIGVANTWIETMPCNFHLRRLSAKVKEGVRAAGGTPMEFNTIAISDGETAGNGRNARFPGQPRSDCLFDRTGLSGAVVRCRRLPCWVR